MNLGAGTISDLKVGASAVSKAYLGGSEVWSTGAAGTPPVFVASGSTDTASGSITGTVSNGILIVAVNDEITVKSWGVPTVNGMAMTSLGEVSSPDGAGSISELFVYPLSGHSGTLALANLTSGGPAYHYGLFDNVSATLRDIDTTAMTGAEFLAAGQAIGGTISSQANDLIFLIAAHGGNNAPLGNNGAGTIMETLNPNSVIMRTSYALGGFAGVNTFEQQFTNTGVFRATAIAAAFQAL